MAQKGYGKRKGGEFERKVCRQLTQWITGKTHPEIYWRSPSSGAKATQDAKAGRASNMGGDIVCTDPAGVGSFLTDHYVLECKFYADFSIEKLFHEKGKVWEWWQQVSRDAEIVDKLPMLIFKKNRHPVYIATKGPDVWRDLPWFNAWLGEYTGRSATFNLGNGDKISIALFEEWLDLTCPTALQKGLAQ